MSTFDALVAELTKDYQRVHPADALQYCAKWFQERLSEQRTRMRETLARHPSLAASLPTDHFMDTPHTAPMPVASPNASYSMQQTPTPLQGGPPTFTNPFPTGGVEQPQGVEFSNPFPPIPTQPHRRSVHLSRSQTGLRTRFDRDGRANYSIDGTPDPHTSVARTATPPMYSDRHATPSPSFNAPHVNPANLGMSTILDRRGSVSAEQISLDDNDTTPLPFYPKTDEQLARIRSYVSGGNILFDGLVEEQVTGVVNAMQERKVKKNEIIIRQGENGSECYVVDSGLCAVYINNNHKSEDPWGSSARSAKRFTTDDAYTPPKEPGKGESHKKFGDWVFDYKQGKSFGELALMYGHARTATVVARQDSTLWSIDRGTFRKIILQAASRRRNMYERFVSMVPLLSNLSAEERSKVADALVSMVYEDGEAVVREGELGDKFFFIEDGEAVVTKMQPGAEDGQLVEVLVGHYHTRGDYFGELALLKLEPRAATVKAKIREPGSNLPKLKVAALEASAFNRLLGPLREIMERRVYRDQYPMLG